MLMSYSQFKLKEQSAVHTIRRKYTHMRNTTLDLEVNSNTDLKYKKLKSYMKITPVANETPGSV